MTTFAKFDKTNLKALRNEMNTVLAKYGAAVNLDFSVGNMSFSEGEVNIKVNAKVKGVKTFDDTMLESRINSMGLKIKNKFGDVLVAYNSRSYKYPYVYVCGKTGKRFKCSSDSVTLRFAA
jgi:uncharacterized protein YunC (DUF1805 family)